jgi:hypothetical protein
VQGAAAASGEGRQVSSPVDEPRPLDGRSPGGVVSARGIPEPPQQSCVAESFSAGAPSSADTTATLLAVMELHHCELMEASAARHRELLDVIQRLEARLDAGTAPQASSTAPLSQASSAAASSSAFVSPVPPFGWLIANGIPAARLAQIQLGTAATELEKEGMDVGLLREAIIKLEAPLSAGRVAQAYNVVKGVRKDCPPQLAKLGKSAALLAREVLVLLIAGAKRGKSLTDGGFVSAMEQAFGKELEEELHSQMKATRWQVCRMGQDRTFFEQQVPKVYHHHDGKSLTDAELDELFQTYADAAVSLRHSVGPPPTSTKPKRKKKLKGAEAVATHAAESVLREEPASRPRGMLPSAKVRPRPTHDRAQEAEPSYVPYGLPRQREWTGGEFIPDPGSEPRSQDFF